MKKGLGSGREKSSRGGKELEREKFLRADKSSEAKFVGRTEERWWMREEGTEGQERSREGAI